MTLLLISFISICKNLKNKYKYNANTIATMQMQCKYYYNLILECTLLLRNVTITYKYNAYSLKEAYFKITLQN